MNNTDPVKVSEGLSELEFGRNWLTDWVSKPPDWENYKMLMWMEWEMYKKWHSLIPYGTHELVKKFVILCYYLRHLICSGKEPCERIWIHSHAKLILCSYTLLLSKLLHSINWRYPLRMLFFLVSDFTICIFVMTGVFFPYGNAGRLKYRLYVTIYITICSTSNSRFLPFCRTMTMKHIVSRTKAA